MGKVKIPEKQAVLDALLAVLSMDRDVRQSLLEAALAVKLDLPENASQREMVEALKRYFLKKFRRDFSRQSVSEASAIIMAI